MGILRASPYKLHLRRAGKLALASGAGAGDAVDPGAVNGVITFIEPMANQVYQRVGNTFDAPISGSFTGNATQIEVRAVPVGTSIDSTAYAWKTVTTDAAAKTFAGTVSVPGALVWYVWQARVVGNPATNKTGSMQFGVGDWVAMLGQSNMVNARSAYSAAPAGTLFALEYEAGVIRRLGNANGGSKGDFQVHIANELTAQLGVPVVLINKSDGGSPIADMIGSGADWTNFVTALQAGSKGTDCALALWLQGESDANTMSTGTYMTQLGTLHSQLRTLTGRGNDTFKFGIISLGAGRYNGSSDGEFGNIRAAQVQYATATPGAFLAGCGHDSYTNSTTDEVHWGKDSFARIGLRVATATRAIYAGNTYAGPKITGASRVGRVVTLTVAHSGGSALKDGSGGAGPALRGFQFMDGAGASVPYTTTSIAGSTISITLDADPSGTLTASYAMRDAPHNAANDPKPLPDYASAVYDNVPVLKSTLGMLMQPLAPITVTGS